MGNYLNKKFSMRFIEFVDQNNIIANSNMDFTNIYKFKYIQMCESNELNWFER